jgi:hypothetical protein
MSSHAMRKLDSLNCPYFRSVFIIVMKKLEDSRFTIPDQLDFGSDCYVNLCRRLNAQSIQELIIKAIVKISESFPMSNFREFKDQLVSPAITAEDQYNIFVAKYLFFEEALYHTVRLNDADLHGPVYNLTSPSQSQSATPSFQPVMSEALLAEELVQAEIEDKGKRARNRTVSPYELEPVIPEISASYSNDPESLSIGETSQLELAVFGITDAFKALAAYSTVKEAQKFLLTHMVYFHDPGSRPEDKEFISRITAQCNGMVPANDVLNREVTDILKRHGWKREDKFDCCPLKFHVATARVDMPKYNILAGRTLICARKSDQVYNEIKKLVESVKRDVEVDTGSL